jgi:DNA-binding IclR family transcriptional regulator
VEPVKVPAALRTLLILQALGRAGSPMTAQALASKLDIPRSSVYQLLEVLEAQGFVVHFPEEKRWSLGVAAFELGSAYLRHDPLERFAQPILNRLLEQVESLKEGGFAAVVQLGVLDGAELLYLLKGATRSHVSAGLAVVTDVGVRLPAHLTASGRSMLALLPSSQFRATYPGSGSSPLTKRTDAGPENLSELTATLKAERTQGFSTEHGAVTADYGSVAAAATNHLALPVAAFAVTFRTDRLTPNGLPNLEAHLATLVKTAATDLGRRLGAK